MMDIERINGFAKDQGYDGVIPLGQWRGYDIYEPVMEQDGTAYLGPPLIIMVREDTIRMSSVEESFEQLDEVGE